MANPLQNILELQGLSKSYGALKVTNNVSLNLTKGEALGIIGPNGAGKSTLFNLIAGTQPADKGAVFLNGDDVTTVSAGACCRLGIGRTYQIPKPFGGMTVLENLLVAATNGGDLAISEATQHGLEILDRLGLAQHADTLAGQLRLLDRKRLEMARALATKPKLLLLDEIAGGLTERECEGLVQTISDIRADGVTIIWIEHVVHALLAVVDRLVVINFGEVLADGPPHETFNAREVQEIYMGIEA